MRGITSMLESKKWTAGLVLIIAVIVAEYFGVQVSAEGRTLILGIAGLVIGGEAVADAAGARATRKSIERSIRGDVDLVELLGLKDEAADA